MDSDFCQVNLCIDLSLKRLGISSEILFNGNNLDSALFADKVHLLDKGVLIYSKYLSKILEQYID